MINHASFTLRNRNPDVLEFIANLSNDEIFTPPVLANQMLDTLANAWSNDNNGANIWEDENVSRGTKAVKQCPQGFCVVFYIAFFTKLWCYKNSNYN